MTRSLILVSLGPVQVFIRQARRTRDLWFGSHALSEISRAAARALVESGAELVFPGADASAITAPLALEPGDAPSVANRLVAILPAGCDAGATVRLCRESAELAWRSFADGALQRVGRPDGIVDTSESGMRAWNEQVDDLLEFDAVWATLGADDYGALLHDLSGELAARKTLRPFAAWPAQRRNVPKSALDGARETVLKQKRADSRLWRTLRIAPTEHLDAIGLIKRAGGRPEQFPPIANIALASWTTTNEEHLGPLIDHFARWGFPRIHRPDLGFTSAFPFDAQLLLPSRAEISFHEHTGEPLPPDVRGALERLWRDAGEPQPYVACLVADGDRVGEALSKVDTPAAHRGLSKRLDEFAQGARRIVENEHHGVLVYAGGDDVLGFVALADAFECAHALSMSFSSLVGGALPDSVTTPTLSVGVGIGHLMEGLGDLLDLGRRAESLAKGDDLPIAQRRNALGVLLDKRSGGVSQWRCRWPQEPLRRLASLMDLLSTGRLPVRRAHEVESLLQRFPDRTTGSDLLLQREAQRILAKAASGEEPLSPEAAGLALDHTSSPAGEVLSDWAGLLRVAKVLARTGGPAT